MALTEVGPRTHGDSTHGDSTHGAETPSGLPGDEQQLGVVEGRDLPPVRPRRDAEDGLGVEARPVGDPLQLAGRVAGVPDLEAGRGPPGPDHALDPGPEQHLYRVE